MGLVSALPPSAPHRHHILPYPSHGLGGRTLRIVVKEWTYYLFVSTRNGSQITYSGVLIDLLQELATRLNFSYTLTLHPHNLTWGQELDNGSWDGPIGMLTRKEMDMAVSHFALTPERSAAADPTSPFIYENSVIIFRAEQHADILSFFLQPFQTPVYVAIGGSFVSVLILLLLLEKCKRSFGGCQKAPSRRKSVLHGVMMDVEVIFAGLIQEPVVHEIKARAGYVLMWAWLMFGVVLASVYSSKLTSSLTVRDQTLPFTSLSQLVNQDTYTWGVARGVYLESVLKTTTNAEYRKFYEGLQRFAKTDPAVFSSDFGVHKSKVLGGRYAFFTIAGGLYELWSQETHNLARIPENYMTNGYVFYLQKESPYTEMVSAEIERMVEVGLVEYWKRKWRPSNQGFHPDVGQSSRVIALNDTQAAFYLAGVGVGLAALTLEIERLVSKIRGGDVSRLDIDCG